ncbi:COQ9 family protein [Tropicimonas sp. S265A]|uniref:COQ9 family protein n=1 Tax=Tropicimonas sp. S265A TaxID=3415134 RepID=UPI003C7B174E
MTDAQQPPADLKEALLDAALIHVAFDGWSETAFAAACTDAGIDRSVARGLFPRGALDLAVAFHRRGDQAMVAKLRAADLGAMRFRDRVATAVRYRLESIDDKEAVRRGATLFALPMHAAEGAKLVWETADHIWSTLGDTSTDVNWYTKRATLSGVYSSTVLYWLGDSSDGHQATWDFLDRRIDDVMKIEDLKASVNKNPVLKGLFAGPNWVLSQIKAPSKLSRTDLPGSYTPK